MKRTRSYQVPVFQFSVALSVLLLATACTSTSSDEAVDGLVSEETPAEVGFDRISEAGDSGNFNVGGGMIASQPEREVESSFRAPVVTGRYVWSANPDSGRVAVIDAQSFEVHSVEAGLRPTQVAALGSEENAARAIVLNRGSRDATLLMLGGDGAFTSMTVPTHGGADTWSVQPAGDFAIAWTDSRNSPNLDPTDGFQDITVIDASDLAAPLAVRLTVGYRPSAFYFNETGTRAFAVTQDGISVVDLESGAIRLSRLIPLPLSSAGQPDVTVLPDGSLALARVAGDTQVHVLDLSPGGTTSLLSLGGVLTDLDVSEDGTWAVGVIRNGLQPVATPIDPDAGVSPGAGAVDAGALAADAGDAGVFPEPTLERYSEAVYIPLPTGLTDASLWQRVRSTRETFGSVALSADASQAALYTTIGNSGRMTLVGSERQVRSVDLLAPVRAVFVTPDASHAVVLQSPAQGSVRKGAFSVVSLTEVRAPKRVASDAPTLAVAIAPNSQRALVTVSDPEEGLSGTYLIRMPSLQVDFAPLPSRPLSTGTIPSVDKAFVAQAHPEGRLTFYDFQSGESRDITGFELSAKVVNE